MELTNRFLSLVVALAVVTGGLVSAQDDWLTNTLRVQTILSANTDVSQLSLCGANGVFNTLAYAPAKWRDVRPDILTGAGSACVFRRCLKGVTDIHSQTLSVIELLDLGIRRISVNLQYTPELAGSLDIRLCRGDTHFYTGCQNLKQILMVDICPVLLGVPTLTNVSTGCTDTSQNLEQGLKIVSSWITQKAANLSYDVLIVDIGDFLTINTPAGARGTIATMLNTIIEKTIGSVLFTVGDLAKFRMGAGVSSTAWPSSKQIVDTYKKRVILLVNAGSLAITSSGFVHVRPSQLSNGFDASTTINTYRSGGNLQSCPSTVAAFQTTYESQKVLYLNEVNDTNHFQQPVSRENGPMEIGVISWQDAINISNCGVSPSFDLINASLIEASCVWTYSDGVSVPSYENMNEKVLFNAASGWTTTTADDSTLRRACQQTANSNIWMVSAVGQSCPQAYTFAVPATSAQSYRLRLALIAANVPSVLLPTNVPGVTRQAQPDSGSGCDQISAISMLSLLLLAFVTSLTM